MLSVAASKIPNPLISIPIIIASHFIEDYIPHWDVGQGLTSKKKQKKTAFFQELFFDFPLSILIIYFLFQVGRPFDWRPWLGWFVGLLPDFIEFPYLFLGHRNPLLNGFARFHSIVHRSTPHKLWGLLPQLLVLLLVVLLK